MYLHIGQDTVVLEKNIVGIFDLDNTTVSRTTREFLNRAEKQNRVEYVNLELPKSFVVCQNEKKEEKVYIAQMAPRTLYKRALLTQSKNR